MPDAAPESLKSSAIPKGGVFALGNFDGVHRGHQAVIKATIEKAHALGIPARVLTFEPHPRAFFKPNLPPFRLTPAPTKQRLLHALGINDVVVEPFTVEFSRLTASDFVEQILIKKFGVQHIVAGFDFVFGQGRGGDMKRLREWLAPHKIGVTEVAPFTDAQGEPVSSSRTRQALVEGDLKTVELILGRHWSIAGIVTQGAQRGRTIGVPTANIALGEYQRPKFGVYAVMAGPAGRPQNIKGVANIGTRPTVDGKNEMLEVHLFDFNADIYGQEWEVALADFIRPEQAFPDFESLHTQIKQDIATARARLQGVKP